VLDISRVGRRLLGDTSAAEDGVRALQDYIVDGVSSYRQYFKIR
jgi:hypothetical protein